MIRLLFADLRQNARIWTWTFVVATLCGAAVSSQFALLEGGRHAALALDDQDMADAAMSVSVTVIVFVALSALAVLSSTTRLAIEGRRPDIGLWCALGMKPRTAGGIIVGELCVIGTLAGIVGSVLAVPCAKALLPLLKSEQVMLPTARPTLAGSSAVWCAVIVAGTCAVSGWFAVRGAMRTPEARLMRGNNSVSVVRRIAGGLVRAALASGAAAGLIATLVVNPQEVEDIFSIVTGSGFAVLALVILLTPWVSPLVERALGVLGSRSVSWYVATRTCAAESGRSSATVLPFTIAIGLTGLFFGWKALGASGVTPAGMFALFGPALIVAWVGGVAVIAMSAGQRRRDGVLLVAAGAQERQLTGIDICEGVVHALTAVVAGLAITFGSLLAGAHIFQVDNSQVLSEGPWIEVGVIALATLITTCVAVAASRALAPTSATLAVLRAAE